MSDDWLDKIGKAATERKQRKDDELAAAQRHQDEMREKGSLGARTLDHIVLPAFKQAADRLKQSGVAADVSQSRGPFGTNEVVIGWGRKHRVSDQKRESGQHAVRIFVDGNSDISVNTASAGGVWGRIDCPAPLTAKWVEDTLSAVIVDAMSHD